ncbi:hypothetical protein RGRSB_0752 [cyanobacterium endosymbiont of Rhopalodia gibberula]|uniref:DUF3288 family protein n=1 Tax=cyanobacterium endosymbiont of Rhopalodia gibberula TaxID=1763363 RepID=UPI000DC73755|nr:DUF3288 family protein [cyanobacterium endosymbiont of Rhopalodia gibberula]BBA79291.1 hypothetical protein RGRSB_0752 [cyanobacterium endosymbiont of Rhopalodia gibberula]
MPQDQQHPREKKDQEVINVLLQEEANPHNLAELARLRIRYHNFPGARQIQNDLDLLLQQWKLTEEQLFEQTRLFHETRQVYQRITGKSAQDWS